MNEQQKLDSPLFPVFLRSARADQVSRLCFAFLRSKMEQNLRCNNQIGGYCRAALTDEAVVTTCS